MTMRRSLPVVLWPEADRTLFDYFYYDGSVLDGRGCLSHHRAASRRTVTFAYACWLGWLALRDPSALSEAPAARVTPARLAGWAEERTDISPVSLASLVSAAMTPFLTSTADGNRTSTKRLIDRLQRRALRHGSQRKTGRIRSTAELWQLGVALATDGAGGPPHALREARRRRDGAMIATLSLLPIRRNAFCNLELGTNVDPYSTYRVTVDADLSKTGRVRSALPPVELISILDDYLHHVRPFLASRARLPDSTLWLNDRGQRLAPNTMTGRITTATRQALGIAVSPHLFRDAAATTLTTQSPKDARAIREILGHSGFDTVDRHYNHAKMIDASRRYAGILTSLKGTSR